MTAFEIYLPKTQERIAEYTPIHLDEILKYVERLITDSHEQKIFVFYWQKGIDGNYYCQQEPFAENATLPPTNEEDFNKLFAIVKPFHTLKDNEPLKITETVSNLINVFHKTKDFILSSQSNYYLIQVYLDDDFVTLPVGPFLNFDSALDGTTKIKNLLPNSTFRIIRNKTILTIK